MGYFNIVVREPFDLLPSAPLELDLHLLGGELGWLGSTTRSYRVYGILRYTDDVEA
jgi:hypothetical protein